MGKLSKQKTKTVFFFMKLLPWRVEKEAGVLTKSQSKYDVNIHGS